jgi:pseudouridine-5'-phosphate glycosidase
MTARVQLDVRPEVADALLAGRSVVALESTLIAHGLPWPANLETARAAEAAIRAEGAIPATIAVRAGRPTVGLSDLELEVFAWGRDVLKASRRDLAVAIAQSRDAATTVAATMALAHQACIRFLATGGIGGAHRPLTAAALSSRERGTGEGWDISADLVELGRTPVAVVCAGAKSILDVPRTLEILETQGVPVVGYGTDEFPAFYLRSSGERVSARVNSPEEAAALVAAHWKLAGAGLVIAQPLPAEAALQADELTDALIRAESSAAESGMRGKELTPFLLGQLAALTDGKTVRANQVLIVENARLAARLACCFALA